MCFKDALFCLNDKFYKEFSVGDKNLFFIGSSYENHVSQMAPAVQELAQLESKTQLNYLKQHHKKFRAG